jgi:hypothetical protein
MIKTGARHLTPSKGGKTLRWSFLAVGAVCTGSLFLIATLWTLRSTDRRIAEQVGSVHHELTVKNQGINCIQSLESEEEGNGLRPPSGPHLALIPPRGLERSPLHCHAIPDQPHLLCIAMPSPTNPTFFSAFLSFDSLCCP